MIMIIKVLIIIIIFKKKQGCLTNSYNPVSLCFETIINGNRNDAEDIE